MSAAKLRKLVRPRRARDATAQGHAPPQTPAHAFGAEVTRLRLDLGWTQAQAGAALGIGGAAVSAIERGKVKPVAYMVAGFRAILRPPAPNNSADTPSEGITEK